MWFSISCRFLRKSHLDSTATLFNTLLIIKQTVKLKCAYQYLKKKSRQMAKIFRISFLWYMLYYLSFYHTTTIYNLIRGFTDCQMPVKSCFWPFKHGKFFEQLCSQLLFAVHIPQDSCLFMYEILRLIRQGWTLYVNEILKQQQAKSIEQWFYLFQVLKAACNVSTSIY